MTSNTNNSWEERFDEIFTYEDNGDLGQIIRSWNGAEPSDVKSFISSELNKQAEELAEKYSKLADEEIDFRLQEQAKEIIESMPDKNDYKGTNIIGMDIEYLTLFKQQLKQRFLKE